MIHHLKCFGTDDIQGSCPVEIDIEADTEKVELLRVWCADHATWTNPRRETGIQYYDWSQHDDETRALGDPDFAAQQEQLKLNFGAQNG